MKLNDWLNSELTSVSNSLEELNHEHFLKEQTIGLAGKETVYKILAHLRSALFPGVYDEHPLNEKRINIYIGNNIRIAAVELGALIEKALVDKCEAFDKVTKDCSICREKANDITIELIKNLPNIREVLHKDIKAAFDGDPAALTTEEILLSYPSINAVSIHRIAHFLYKQDVPIIPRIMSEYAHQLTGIDIHPGATIGEYFFIDHGTGVVIGETATIGEHVKLYQGVTLGAKSFPLDENGNPIKGIKRHPNIEDYVVIYAGATILGGDTVIGHHSEVGGNVWLRNSIPPYTKVYNSRPSLNIRSDAKSEKDWDDFII